VLLGGAEVPCCAAATRTRDDDRTIRESCMVRATTGQRMGEMEKEMRTEALPDLLFIQSSRPVLYCTAIHGTAADMCGKITCRRELGTMSSGGSNKCRSWVAFVEHMVPC
jgi:hypothetical protein